MTTPNTRERSVSAATSSLHIPSIHFGSPADCTLDGDFLPEPDHHISAQRLVFIEKPDLAVPAPAYHASQRPAVGALHGSASSSSLADLTLHHPTVGPAHAPYLANPSELPLAAYDLNDTAGFVTYKSRQSVAQASATIDASNDDVDHTGAAAYLAIQPSIPVATLSLAQTYTPPPYRQMPPPSTDVLYPTPPSPTRTSTALTSHGSQTNLSFSTLGTYVGPTILAGTETETEAVNDMTEKNHPLVIDCVNCQKRVTTVFKKQNGKHN
ncbi:hypothetical protein IWQ60_007564 [Tieghemiomyces parasiticus]|uniref:Uncharacterized protein n=1 Tax=Tieghemiomyces parasiticus TaxID=78921 RepID=A0A9W8DNP8_9FUNG|nr:hypothetical protein IWQ60_007564 [Tieghemiomyces parasiticus]